VPLFPVSIDSRPARTRQMFDKKISELIAHFVQKITAMAPIEREERNVGFEMDRHCQGHVYKRHFEIVGDGSSGEFGLINHKSVNLCVNHRVGRAVQSHNRAGEHSLRRVPDRRHSVKAAELLVEPSQGPGWKFVPANLDKVEPRRFDSRFKIGNLKKADAVPSLLKPSAKCRKGIDVSRSRKAQEAQMTHVVDCPLGRFALIREAGLFGD
jgi:hypothetical protein